MKYVFWGTPRFAEIILDRMITAGMPPVALVCNPDRPVGRKKVITPPPTKQRAISGDSSFIDILQPERFDEAFIKRLKAIEPDLFVVAAYAKILPKTILDIPRHGTLGVHPSLLPKYRGASPIQSVILAGEHETGVTLYLMDEKMDHGAVVAQEKCPAGDGTIGYPDLEKTLADLSAGLLVKTLQAFADKKVAAKPQDESRASYTKKFTAEDGFVSEDDLRKALGGGDAAGAASIVRKINALTPEPGVWTKKAGTRVKLLAAHVRDGALILSKIQEEGKTPKAP
ncbi:MAG TPA: methionyl-tRNA formyltransferase [Candidatus Paceibacterota bacterium]|jgi:methionyl-tRNA formyltransferase|nr:methionyl-tRNA formyltransferase [Candidatus Paceibacterota bacterium]